MAVGQPDRGHADRHPGHRVDLDRPVGPHLHVPDHRRGRAGGGRRRALPGAPPAQHRRPLPGGVPRRRAGQQHAGQRGGRAVSGRRDRLVPPRRHGLGPPGGGPLRARSPHPPAVPVGHPGGRPGGPGGGDTAGGGVPPARLAGGAGRPRSRRAGPDRRPLRLARRRRRAARGRAVAPAAPPRALWGATVARHAGPPPGDERPRAGQRAGAGQRRGRSPAGAARAAHRAQPAAQGPLGPRRSHRPPELAGLAAATC